MMFKVVLGYRTSSSLWGEIPHSSLYDPKILGTQTSTLGTRPHSPKPHTDSPITLHDNTNLGGLGRKRQGTHDQAGLAQSQYTLLLIVSLVTHPTKK